MRLEWSMHQALVEYAQSFGTARIRLQWRCGVVGGGGVLEPWASSDSSPSQNPGSHRQGIPGNSGNFASSDGIVRGRTNHDPRRGGISVM